jgi:hypothetical protein
MLRKERRESQDRKGKEILTSQAARRVCQRVQRPGVLGRDVGVVGAEAPRREGAQREHAAEEDHRLAGGRDAGQEREPDGRAQEGDGLDDLADLHGRKGSGFGSRRFIVLS